MEDDVFKLYVEEAVALLPREFREKLNNVSIFIQDYPTQEQLASLGPSASPLHLLGQYKGVPLINRGHYGIGGALPDTIFIFKMPILSKVRSETELVELIRDTVWHEIGHHFGMSEKEIREAEEVRRNKKF